MALIEIRNVIKSFEGNHVLRGIDLDVGQGSTMVILGKSGTGKSVLLKKRKELNELRKSMGYLFQSSALYDSMSVRENLAFPLLRQEELDHDELEARIISQLRVVGLLDAIDKMPSELSGGMKKRIGLARALITNPKIMLYDEPTTGLDPITSREISYLIKSMQERYQPTSIAVTHDMQCARIIADTAAILHDGLLDQGGTIESLERSQDPEVRSFFATQ
jgi:phospholipid/cholesterol/gamma-HCH transport system ATP-binding protein